MRGTKIEWCDDTVSGQMGCDGCELDSRHGAGTCYAEVLTKRHAGAKGWPAGFYAAQIFPGRIEAACRWRDLTGTDRPDKPWLNGRPRHVFLDDMGDTFTESLPLDWIAPRVPAMAASPHVWMFLTKRPGRMAEFWRRYGPVPPNFMLGTSITTSTARLHELVKIPNATLYASVEPMLRALDLSPFVADRKLSLTILGGESGPGARPLNIAWIRLALAQCLTYQCAAFVKQLGSQVRWNGNGAPFPSGTRTEEAFDAGAFAMRLRDRKGGDMSEWPIDIRIREFPEPRHA